MKRQQNKQNINNNKKKLIITKFEDLSNEIIYEIFEYFDYCSIYEIFINFNIRFKSLLIKFSLPLKINLSLISKSNFQYQYNNIIIPNIKRIISLNLSKYFLEYFTINLFISLESLIIYQIESEKIFLLITHLNTLLNFKSLTIYFSNYFQDENSIYLAIFRLLKLKFCKLTFPSGGERLPLSINTTNQYSTIEYLIINGQCRLDQLSSILSYLPQLHHLSCQYLYGYECTDILIPLNLTSICFIVYHIKFDELKLFLSKISFRLKKLRIKISNDENYFHAEQWEQFIFDYMPCLTIFDFQYSILIHDNSHKILIDKFSSNFFLERKWFFDYYYYKHENSSYLNFFSTIPYRYNHFILYEPINNSNNKLKLYENNNINFAYHLTIEGILKSNNYSIKFPRITKLTLKDNNIYKNSLFIHDVNLIVHLIQITDLDINNEQYLMIELIQILNSLPNLQSLTLSNISSLKFKQTKNTELLSKNNKIIKLIIDNDECELKHIEFFRHLFPYLKYIEININEKNFIDILRYLLLKFKYLFSLYLLNINSQLIEKIEILIENEKLLYDYTIEYIHGGLYLWW